MAQSAPPPPEGALLNVSVPSSGTQPSPVRTPGSSGYMGAASNIRNMQKAIQNFANQVSTYKIDSKNPTKVAPEDKRKDFNDFLAEQYSAGSKIHGEEFDTSPEATSQDQKRPTDIIELDNVIDGLRRIGPGKKESMSDGIWDFRTNNAIKNIYAIADALIRVSDDFGGIFPNSAKAFRYADLKKMDSAIPKEKDPRKVPSAILNQKSSILIPLIDKLTEFYNIYSKYVLNHPAYKGYIEKSKPLITITPGAEDSGKIPDNLKQYMDKLDQLFLQNVNIPAKNGVNGSIVIGKLPLTVIKDLPNLQNFMMKFLGYNDNDISNPEIQSRVLNAIMNNANSINVQPQSMQLSQPQSTNRNTWDRI